MPRLLMLVIGCLLFSAAGRTQDSTWVSPDLLIVQQSPTLYQHISWFENPNFGRFPCNGMLLVKNGDALLFDTPMTDSSTVDLLRFITDSLNATLTGFVPNHFHEDCTEGIDQFPATGVLMYCHQQTHDSLQTDSFQLQTLPFSETLNMPFHGIDVHLTYHGPAHAPDNIVAWVPAENTLFAGCMCKSANSTTLGWTGHADLTQWPVTIQKVLDAYPSAALVIPGHGASGGRELLQHTLDLLNAPAD